MSGTTGKGKKREDHDTASDGDAETHAPPKKSLKKDSDDDNSDDIVVAEVGSSKPPIHFSRVLFRFSRVLFFNSLISFNVACQEQEGFCEDLAG
jgi:hypothetical protein